MDRDEGDEEVWDEDEEDGRRGFACVLELEGGSEEVGVGADARFLLVLGDVAEERGIESEIDGTPLVVPAPTLELGLGREAGDRVRLEGRVWVECGDDDRCVGLLPP